MGDAHAAPRSAAIKARAIDLGFDVVGIVDAGAIPEAGGRLREFLRLGRHGDMGWMAARAGERGDPRNLWPDVRSIVMLGVNYGPAEDPLAALGERDKGSISVYARNRDYHDVVKKKLKRFGGLIAQEYACEVKVFVDTAPVMEKPLAAAAGIGWQGKHTNLVSRAHGSWLFLGAVFTTLDLEADEAAEDHCGDCRRCLDVCPTSAFPAPYQLDARRCISYLTIEHKGAIPLEFREAIGNRIYGCDDCLAVCPWNKFASVSREAQLAARADLNAPDLAALSELSDVAFREKFAGSPIKRIGRDRFLRNVLLAIGNSGMPALSDAARAHLRDPSAVVRGAAVWALSRLTTEGEFRAAAKENAGTETDPGVLQEWRARD
jgi:epoxyqueuosine reductase